MAEMDPNLFNALRSYRSAKRAQSGREITRSAGLMGALTAGQDAQTALANQPGRLGTVTLPGQAGLTPQERIEAQRKIGELQAGLQKERIGAVAGVAKNAHDRYIDKIKQGVELFKASAQLRGTITTASVQGHIARLDNLLTSVQLVSDAELTDLHKGNASTELQREIYAAEQEVFGNGAILPTGSSGDTSRDPAAYFQTEEGQRAVQSFMASGVGTAKEKARKLALVAGQYKVSVESIIQARDPTTGEVSAARSQTEAAYIKMLEKAAEESQAVVNNSHDVSAALNEVLSAGTGAGGQGQVNLLNQAAADLMRGLDVDPQTLEEIGRQLEEGNPDPEGIQRAQAELDATPNATPGQTTDLEGAKRAIMESDAFQTYAVNSGYEPNEAAFQKFVGEVRKKQAAGRKLAATAKQAEPFTAPLPKAAAAPTPSPTASFSHKRNNIAAGLAEDGDDDSTQN